MPPSSPAAAGGTRSRGSAPPCPWPTSTSCRPPTRCAGGRAGGTPTPPTSTRKERAMIDMTPEQTEDFLSLWERAIELSDPNRRDARETERAGIWTAETQSRRLARSVLSDIRRNANVETDAGRELAEACAALRSSLDPA